MVHKPKLSGFGAENCEVIYSFLDFLTIRNYLESASIKTNTDKLFLDALIADRSIRMKQARGLKWFIFFSTTEKRAICYDWEHSDKQWDE